MSNRGVHGAAALSPAGLRPEEAAEWWMKLGQAVEELARRYPRTYGASIPAVWRNDLETVEVLASITRWREELDRQYCVAREAHAAAEDLDSVEHAVSSLEQSRREWEWHAHRDQWLARLGETGSSPLRTDVLKAPS